MSNLRPRVVCTELLRLVFASKVGDFYGFLGSLGPLLRLSLCYYQCAILIDVRFFGVILPKNQVASSTFGLLHWVGRVLNNSTKGIALLNGRREPQGTAGDNPQSPSSLWYVHSFWPLENAPSYTKVTVWVHGTFQVGQKLIFAKSRFQTNSIGNSMGILGVAISIQAIPLHPWNHVEPWTLLDAGAMNSAPSDLRLRQQLGITCWSAPPGRWRVSPGSRSASPARNPWVISHVPMFHITNHDRYMVFLMATIRWCPIAPKWDIYQSLESGAFDCWPWDLQFANPGFGRSLKAQECTESLILSGTPQETQWLKCINTLHRGVRSKLVPTKRYCFNNCPLVI